MKKEHVSKMEPKPKINPIGTIYHFVTDMEILGLRL